MTKKRIMSIVLIGVLLATLLVGALFACSVLTEDGSDNYVAVDGEGNQMESGKVYFMPSKMSFSAAALAAAEGQGVTINLQATVLPVEAQNKAVDWTVEWRNASTYGENPVTDYVTVTPQADGSNIASVTCFKAFPGDTIAVTVVTRDGGFTASCLITFVGNPASLSIIATDAEVIDDSGWGVSIANVFTGRYYNFELKLDNVFHSVDSSFVPNYSCEIVGIGNIILHRERKLYTEVEVSDLTFSVSDSFTVSPGGGASDYVLSIRELLFGASIVDNKLQIYANKTVSAIRVRHEIRTTYDSYTFKEYENIDKKPYFEIIVTEANTGLSQTINIRLEASVSEVQLNNSELTF